jgi:F0F1-type ATP synthase delta subunit
MANGKRFLGEFAEVLGTAIAAVGLDAMLKQMLQKGTTQAATQVATQIRNQLADERGEILVDLEKLAKAGNQMDNLWRRLDKEVARVGHDNRIMHLLGKIPKDQDKGRRSTLAYLDKMDDKRFEQAMELLNHDNFMHLAKKIVREGGELSREALEKSLVGVNSAAHAAADAFDAFNAWLES